MGKFRLEFMDEVSNKYAEWKNPPKWQKNDLVSRGHGRAAKLGACVNWVDWLRTSADKRMWS